ncbi:calyx/pep [Catopsilia pomona nucleopolyhedrovirus]|uniref:Calyx/pep n=1 Tax=Catopsilia pomona nucleopolyhedrovirus TaxID=1850906 RepID=A0A172WZA2_9ABAC|nr:calyx/pep [Catopsilia pomona nucleopolyhedrovirus]ANF29671.1 calyx/pep [Catopsilia pomona nucleopolyhedrovirus]
MTPNHVMFDDASVMWIDTDYIYQNLKMPLAAFQQLLFSLPSKHRKMMNDGIGNAKQLSSTTSSLSSSSCHNTVRYMVDIYGAAVLVLRHPCSFADHLLTTFVANNYLSYCCRRRRSRSRSCSRRRSRSCSRRSRSRSRSKSRSRSGCWRRQMFETLEKIGHQSDLLVNGVNQISLNQSNHFLEISTALSGIRAQTAQILPYFETLKDAILARLSALLEEIKSVLPDYSKQLAELAKQLTDAISAMQTTLKNELNNTNAILANLASSITNINGTLNNVLTALENLADELGDGTFTNEDRSTLQSVLDIINEIKSILLGVGARK